MFNVATKSGNLRFGLSSSFHLINYRRVFSSIVFKQKVIGGILVGECTVLLYFLFTSFNSSIQLATTYSKIVFLRSFSDSFNEVFSRNSSFGGRAANFFDFVTLLDISNYFVHKFFSTICLN